MNKNAYGQDLSQLFLGESDFSDENDNVDSADKEFWEKSTFLKEEQEFCILLEDLIYNYIKKIVTTKFEILEVFGRIDLLYSYQKNSFLPDLTSSCSIIDIVKCFIKHQKLFNIHYNNYFMNLPNMILVLKENLDIFSNVDSEETYKKREDFLIIGLSKRIQTYHSFLEMTKMRNSNSNSILYFNRAIKIIETLAEKSSSNDTVSFIISEIVETERVYLNKLKIQAEEVYSEVVKVFKHAAKRNSVIGMTPQILRNQHHLYHELRKCLFDFDPNETAECFLQHRDKFQLYIQDSRLKNNPGVIDELEEFLNKNQGKLFELYAPLNRLFKYQLLLQGLQKSANKQNIKCAKVQEALDFINDTIHEINNVAAVNCIRDENIHLDCQGDLLMRDIFLIKKGSESYEGMVFLFEKVIVFTETITEGRQKNRRDVYVYKNHIITKYLAVNILEMYDNSFQVGYHGKNNRFYFTLTCENKDTLDKWINITSELIKKQFLN